jgi:hypothetical protein
MLMTEWIRATWHAGVALVTLAALAWSPIAAAACPNPHLEAALLGAQTEIATDGGIIIHQIRDRGVGEHRVAPQLDGKLATFVSEYLAPGLERWKIAGAAGATVNVLGPNDVVTATMAITSGDARLRAPAIRAARSTVKRTPRSKWPRPGAPVTTLTIELGGAAPEGAVALVVYGAGGRADPGIAWVAVTPGETRYQINGGGKGCGGGAGPDLARDRISFAWLDARGRLSPRSARRTVGLARPASAAASE